MFVCEPLCVCVCVFMDACPCYLFSSPGLLSVFKYTHMYLTLLYTAAAAAVCFFFSWLFSCLLVSLVFSCAVGSLHSFLITRCESLKTKGPRRPTRKHTHTHTHLGLVGRSVQECVVNCCAEMTQLLDLNCNTSASHYI